jgi:VanZ family protein
MYQSACRLSCLGIRHDAVEHRNCSIPERTNSNRSRLNRIALSLFNSHTKMRSLLNRFIFDPQYRKLEFRSAFLLYLMVLVFGSIPGARVEIGQFASGMVLHGLTYALITLLLFNGGNGDRWHKAWKSFLIVVAMGALDEFVQSFFPYRTASVTDWFVDISAAFFTLVLLWFFWPKAVGQNMASTNRSSPLSRKFPDHLN